MTDVVFTDVVFENRVALIREIVSQYLKETDFRCYLKPAKINGHPVGYCGARTFKIIEVKTRRKKK